MKQIQSHIGLRGCAALLVVFYHIHFLPGHLPFEDATDFFARSYLMVDLFFILSGFIIAYVYGDIRASGPAFRDFMLKRIIRLYPLHLFCLMFFLACELCAYALFLLAGQHPIPFWQVPGTWINFTAQLFLVHAFLPWPPGWNIPSWSISAELFAYCLFPFAIVFLRRKPALATTIFLLVSAGYYGRIATSTGSLDVTHGLAALRCLSGFLLGMLIHQYRAPLHRLGSVTLSSIQIVALAAIITFLCLPVNDVLLIIPFVALAAATIDDRGVLARLLSLRPCQVLGDLSYSVYLIHVPLFLLLYPVVLGASHRMGLSADVERGLWILVAISAVLLLSFFTFHMVEVPARKWLTRRFVKRAAA